MEAYQQRVIDEKDELDVKGTKLGEFLDSELYLALPEDEQSLLVAQYEVMQEYSDILDQRIMIFKEHENDY